MTLLRTERRPWPGVSPKVKYKLRPRPVQWPSPKLLHSPQLSSLLRNGKRAW